MSMQIDTLLFCNYNELFSGLCSNFLELSYFSIKNAKCSLVPASQLCGFSVFLFYNIGN